MLRTHILHAGTAPARSTTGVIPKAPGVAKSPSKRIQDGLQVEVLRALVRCNEFLPADYITR